MSKPTPDARKAAVKHQLAAAETAGDADAVKRLRGELGEVNDEIRAIAAKQEREAAAARRREAAKDDTDARTKAPEQRATKADARQQKS